MAPRDRSHGEADGLCGYDGPDGQPRVQVPGRTNLADQATTLIHEYAHALLSSKRDEEP